MNKKKFKLKKKNSLDFSRSIVCEIIASNVTVPAFSELRRIFYENTRNLYAKISKAFSVTRRILEERHLKILFRSSKFLSACGFIMLTVRGKASSAINTNGISMIHCHLKSDFHITLAVVEVLVSFERH